MGGESWYTTKIFKPHSQISRLGMQTIGLLLILRQFFHGTILITSISNINNFNLKCLT